MFPVFECGCFWTVGPIEDADFATRRYSSVAAMLQLGRVNTAIGPSEYSYWASVSAVFDGVPCLELSSGCVFWVFDWLACFCVLVLFLFFLVLLRAWKGLQVGSRGAPPHGMACLFCLCFFGQAMYSFGCERAICGDFIFICACFCCLFFVLTLSCGEGLCCWECASVRQRFSVFCTCLVNSSLYIAARVVSPLKARLRVSLNIIIIIIPTYMTTPVSQAESQMICCMECLMDMKEELIDGSSIKVPLFGDCIWSPFFFWSFDSMQIKLN